MDTTTVQQSCESLPYEQILSTIGSHLNLWLNLITIWLLLVFGFWLQKKIRLILPLSVTASAAAASWPPSSPIETFHNILVAFAPLLYVLSVYEIRGFYHDGYIDLSLFLISSILLYLLYYTVVYHKLIN